MVEVIEVHGDWEDFDDIWSKGEWSTWAHYHGGWWVAEVGWC